MWAQCPYMGHHQKKKTEEKKPSDDTTNGVDHSQWLKNDHLFLSFFYLEKIKSDLLVARKDAVNVARNIKGNAYLLFKLDVGMLCAAHLTPYIAHPFPLNIRWLPMRSNFLDFMLNRF